MKIKKIIVRGLTIFEKNKPKFFEEDEHIYEKDHQRLSFKLSRTITIRVVVLILLILFINPFLDVENYIEVDSAYIFEIDLLSNLLYTK